MSSIRNFAEAISPTVPDRGLRRRGVVAGNEVPVTDLDAYVKHLCRVSVSEQALNRRSTHTEWGTLSTATAFDVWSPMIGTGGVGLSATQYLYVTAAGVMRIFNPIAGTNVASGPTGHTSLTKMIPVSTGHVMIFSTPATRLANPLGTSVSSAWTMAFSDLVELPNGRVVAIQPGTPANLRTYASIANASTNTSGTTVASSNNSWFLCSFGNSVYAVGVNTSGVEVRYSPDSGVTWFQTDIVNQAPIDGDHEFDMQANGASAAAILNGVCWVRVDLGGLKVAEFYPDGSYGKLKTAKLIDDDGRVLSDFPSNIGMPILSFGGLLVTRDDALGTGNIYYSSDAVNWRYHSTGLATQFFSVVGNRLFYSNDAATFVYSLSGGF